MDSDHAHILYDKRKGMQRNWECFHHTCGRRLLAEGYFSLVAGRHALDFRFLHAMHAVETHLLLAVGTFSKSFTLALDFPD